MLSKRRMERFERNKTLLNYLVGVMMIYFIVMLVLPLSIYDTRMDKIMIIHKGSLYKAEDNQKVQVVNTLISDTYNQMSGFSPIKMITNKDYIYEQNDKAIKNIRLMKSINKSIENSDLKMIVSKNIVEVEDIYVDSCPLDLIKRLIASPAGIIFTLLLRRLLTKDLEYQLKNNKPISLLIPNV